MGGHRGGAGVDRDRDEPHPLSEQRRELRAQIAGATAEQAFEVATHGGEFARSRVRVEPHDEARRRLVEARLHEVRALLVEVECVVHHLTAEQLGERGGELEVVPGLGAGELVSVAGVVVVEQGDGGRLRVLVAGGASDAPLPRC